MFNKEEISVGAARHAVQMFASLVLDLSPVSPDQAQGFFGRYSDGGKIKWFFVSHFFITEDTQLHIKRINHV